jgi:hypothetical protein
MANNFWLFLFLGISLGTVLGAMGLGLFVGSRGRRIAVLRGSPGRGLTPEEAELSISDFLREANLLLKKQETLNVYAADYFHTLQGSGLSELAELVKHLEVVQERLQDLFEEGSYTDAYQLSEFLLDRLPPHEIAQAQAQFGAYAHLKNWRQKASDLVLQILENLEAAALKTKDLGIARNRNRKPTLMAISDLQNLIQK